MGILRKSPDAFRTISEVAQDLDLPQHVLRFWETRFSQIKPMKRGGGRRYYRPDDVDLLRGIRHLLYDEGYTIKGVQRILKEQGVRFVVDSVDGEAAGQERAVEPQSVAVAGGSTQQAYTEPNQLELQRPPLVSPHGGDGHPVHPAATTASQPHIHHTPPQTQMHAAAQVSPQPGVEVSPSMTSVEQQATHYQPAHHGVQAPAQIPHAQATAPAAPPAQMNIQHAMAYGGGISPEMEVALRSAPSVQERGTDPSSTVSLPPPAPQMATAVPQPDVGMMMNPNAASAFTSQLHREKAPVDREDHHRDLAEGDPKYLRGESASMSIGQGHAKYIDEEQKSGFLSRLRGRSEQGESDSRNGKYMGRDDVRRLQSTLFEMLECKRILDQARSSE